MKQLTLADPQYYQSSDKFESSGLFLIIMFGLISSVGLGIIYGYIIYYLPIVYFNVICTFLLGGFIGYFVSLGGKKGKIRNAKLVLISGFLFSVIGLYVAWVSWFHAFSKQELIALDPLLLKELIRKVSVVGAWSFNDTTPTDGILYACWAIEAFIIIGSGGTIASKTFEFTPFCENCYEWITIKDSISRLEPIDDPNEFIRQLEIGNFSVVTSLNKTKGNNESISTQIDLFHCPKCKKKYLLTVLMVLLGLDSEHNLKKESHSIVEYFLITQNQFEKLKTNWRKTPAKNQKNIM